MQHLVTVAPRHVEGPQNRLHSWRRIASAFRRQRAERIIGGTRDEVNDRSRQVKGGRAASQPQGDLERMEFLSHFGHLSPCICASPILLVV